MVVVRTVDWFGGGGGGGGSGRLSCLNSTD